MKIIHLILLPIFVVAFYACSDKASDTKQSTASVSKSEKVNDTKQSATDKTPQSQQAVQFVVANNYSKNDWKNGVLQKNGRSNLFYFVRRESVSINIKVGDTLNFAKTGKAIVQKVNELPPDENRLVSVYVTVDKDIDPVGDGNPNKIYIGN